MSLPRLKGNVPVGENGFPIPAIQRVWQGKSAHQAAVPTTGAALLARPSGVTGPLYCRVMNVGANPAFFYFSATNSLSPLPGVTHQRLAANASAVAVMLDTESYVVAAATATTTDIRVEFLNQEL